MLRRLAEAIAQKQRDRGDTPVEERSVIARWTTWEEAREEAESSLPRCPVCGRRRKADKDTCSRLCAVLRAYLKPKFLLRTPGAKRLWAACAASADVLAAGIAALLETPVETVDAWLGVPALREALVRIRRERGQSTALLEPVARVLGMSTNALHAYLTGGYRPKGKQHRVRLRHGRYIRSLAALLGMGEDECAEAFDVDLFTPYARKRIRQLQPTRWGSRPLRSYQGRTAFSCADERQAHDLCLRGKSDSEIADEFLERALTPKELYWSRIQHVRGCGNERCRAGLALDLHARGRTVRQIAKLLRKSSRDVEQALRRGRAQMPAFAYGALTVTEAARRLGKSPRQVRAFSDVSKMPATRTPGGWRAFDPRTLPPAR